VLKRRIRRRCPRTAAFSAAVTSRANEYLVEAGREPIDWRLPEIAERSPDARRRLGVGAGRNAKRRALSGRGVFV
jgi:hypothetical protein